jgi:hypothetical protein
VGIGPGHYSPERADTVTKPSVSTVKIGLNPSPSRPDSFAHPSQIEVHGPGSYDTGYKFGDDAKAFRIGEKRPEK